MVTVESDAEVANEDDAQSADDHSDSDEESGQSCSDSNSPVRRMSVRDRKQARVFTYDEKGVAGWKNR